MKLVLQSPVVAALVLVLGLGACVWWMGEHPIRLEHGGRLTHRGIDLDVDVPSSISIDGDIDVGGKSFKAENGKWYPDRINLSHDGIVLDVPSRLDVTHSGGIRDN